MKSIMHPVNKLFTQQLELKRGDSYLKWILSIMTVLLNSLVDMGLFGIVTLSFRTSLFLQTPMIWNVQLFLKLYKIFLFIYWFISV